LEACEALKGIWGKLQRTYHQARDGSDAPDIDGPGCPVWIEVKRQERINIHEAMNQALDATRTSDRRIIGTFDGHPITASSLGNSRPPAILHKRNRGEWLVTVRASDLARLMGR
jgi:hypothetical protein